MTVWALCALALLVACERPAPSPGTPLVDLLTLSPSSVALETRRFRFGADDRKPLLSGWSSRNERDQRRRAFVWATAEEARFGLTVLRVENKQALVTLRAFPSAEPQRIEVKVNDRPLATFPAETDDREMRFVIPASTLRLGENVLSFHHTFLTPGPNPRDSRRFAAAYGSLLVGPECLPLRAHGEPEPTRVERPKDKKSLLITGPAAVAWTVDVPERATFAAKLSLPSRSAGAAEVILEARTEGEWAPLAEATLRRPWLLSTTRARLSADLSKLAGRRAELRILVRPFPCESTLATVRVKRAAIALQTADRP